MDFFAFLPIILRIIALAPKIEETLAKKQSAIDLLNQLAPDLLPILQDIGGRLFPNLGSAEKVEAGALILSPEYVRQLQTNLNKLTKAGLGVDGQYGPKTKAAVSAFQKAHGLEIDGWAGKLTAAVIEQELAK